MSRLHAALLPVILGLSLGPTTAAAVERARPSAAELSPAQEQVRSLLSGYEEVPGPDVWRKLKGGDEELRRIAVDRREDVVLRARACEVLGWLPSSQPTLQQVLANRSNPEAVRAGAVTGLLRTQARKEALSTLAKTLNDTQPLVRYRSAVELKRLGWAQGRALLRKRAAVEKDGSVLRVINEALKSTRQ